MFFRHLENVLSRPDNSKTKLRCLEDVLRQLGLRNILNSIISVKYFIVAWQDSRTRIWVFLYNVIIQETFSETKIWDRVCLTNIQNFKISMKCFTVHDQTKKHEFGCFYTKQVHKNYFKKVVCLSLFSLLKIVCLRNIHNF